MKTEDPHRRRRNALRLMGQYSRMRAPRARVGERYGTAAMVGYWFWVLGSWFFVLGSWCFLKKKKPPPGWERPGVAVRMW